jgi:uncharacterized DUF497 family protein
MKFEYDPTKSVSNKAKHGLDFDEARALWDDGSRIEFEARTTIEARWLMVGRIGDKLWTAVFTIRNEAVRLISVRRARDEERQWYEDDQGQ